VVQAVLREGLRDWEV